jgi:hypothetical protein
MYRHHWQADEQKQSIAKITGTMTGKRNEGKRKISDRNHQNSIGGRSSTCKVNTSRGRRGGRGIDRCGRSGRGTSSEHLKSV